MNQDNSQEFQVVLTLGELGNILQGLQYVQYGTAFPIIEKLQKQVAEQIAASKEETKPEVSSPNPILGE